MKPLFYYSHFRTPLSLTCLISMSPISRACLSTPMVPYALADAYGSFVAACPLPSLRQPLNTLDMHPSSLISLLKPSVSRTPISRPLSPVPHISPSVSLQSLFHLHTPFGPCSLSDPQAPIILFVPPSTHPWSPGVPMSLRISLTPMDPTRIWHPQVPLSSSFSLPSMFTIWLPDANYSLCAP